MTKRGHSYKGLFASFDGRDGSGKSTQRNMLADYLKQEGYDVVTVRDPGGTKAGNQIRHILLHSDLEIDPHTELLLFEASRAQLVGQIIKPALLEGKVVLSDRFWDATTAYQGTAGKVPHHIIYQANLTASQGIEPDRTYILDLSEEEEALKRLGGEHDRMERKSQDFHKQVRQAFIGLSLLHPERIKLLNTDSTSAADIHLQIREDMNKYIKDHNLDEKLLRIN